MATVTQIDVNYLNRLKAELETVLQGVNAVLQGGGASSGPNTTLSVLAGTSGFSAATSVNAALQAMGGRIHDQLVWLKKMVTDMINEITTTLSSFSPTESLNTETVYQLLSGFSAVINDFNNPPGSNPKSGG